MLLKNDGVLPLKKNDTVAVFGVHQIEYIKGGTGSGNVIVSKIASGVPMGTDIDYLDSMTLEMALEDRKKISNNNE